MADRYFVDQPISADRVTLTGPEAHHLIHVMRAAPGAHVTLFDGSGAEFSATVERVGRSDVQLVILARHSVDRELPFGLTLGVAMPKGDRQKWLVEKAVELGVTRIVPLRSYRGVAQPVEQALLRLRRAVIEASKQCGRNHLLKIDEPQSWPDFVAAPDASCRLVAHPAGDCPDLRGLRGAAVVDKNWTVLLGAPVCRTGILPAQATPASTDRLLPQRPLGENVRAAIGPEGGFTDDEVAMALSADWQIVDLGPRILRVETAALAMAVAIATVQGG